LTLPDYFCELRPDIFRLVEWTPPSGQKTHPKYIDSINNTDKATKIRILVINKPLGTRASLRPRLKLIRPIFYYFNDPERGLVVPKLTFIEK
jgi:hypothetical protein